MEASLLPRKNYASTISNRLNVDPIEQGDEEFHRITNHTHHGSSRARMVSSCQPRLRLAVLSLSNRFLAAQQKQPSNREYDPQDTLPRCWFAEKQDARDRHECRTTSQNCGNG